MTYNFDDLIKQLGNNYLHGTIPIALTQDAYLAGTNECPHYEAHAIDRDLNDYRVIWDVKDGWEEIENEDEVCDWDVYEVVEA